MRCWAHATRSCITLSFQSVSGPQVAAQIAVPEQVRRNFLSDSYTILSTTYSLVPPPRRRPKISRTYRQISILCSTWQVSFPIGQFTVVITPPRADHEQLDRYPGCPCIAALPYSPRFPCDVVRCCEQAAFRLRLAGPYTSAGQEPAE
jgi:hypothetical protein